MHIHTNRTFEVRPHTLIFKLSFSEAEHFALFLLWRGLLGRHLLKLLLVRRELVLGLRIGLLAGHILLRRRILLRRHQVLP